MNAFRHGRPRKDNRGVALVMVLLFLVLLLGLVVALLGRAATERTAAAGYEASVSATHLAEQAVALVQAQIHHASTQSQSGQAISWASQPGMVRTFLPDGGLSRAYKLYSAADLVVSGADFQSSMTEDQTYVSVEGFMTDLNAPVFSRGQWRFPILDPRVLGKFSADTGFAVDSPPSGFANNPQAPMPVRWLYVLREGQLIAPVLGPENKIMVAGATAANPIVGRVAFWTDDETCKLNVNTSSHGTYWDIPRATTQSEMNPGYARIQPVVNEFQRYPGHPATTSLFPVLAPLLNIALDGEGNPSADVLRKFYGLDSAPGMVPRIQFGGSQMGTVERTAAQRVELDDSRLYASVDELIFDPNRGIQELGTGADLDKDVLEQARFFLTASSRAPELNCFRYPRIGIWPINAGDKQPGSVTKLIAKATEINGTVYSLQRENSTDIAEDFALNRPLFDYLRHFMDQPFPGFGNKSFSGKVGSDEADQIAFMMLDYVRASNIMSNGDGEDLFCEPAPGKIISRTRSLGDSQSGAYLGSRSGQISPLEDEGLDARGFGRIPTITKAVLHFYIDDISSEGTSLLPPKPYPGNGSGDQLSTPFADKVIPVDFSATPAGSPVDVSTRAVLYFDFFDPMLGYPLVSYNFDVRVKFSGGWTVSGGGVDGQPLHFPDATFPVMGDMIYGWDYTQPGAASRGNSLAARAATYAATSFGGQRTLLWLLNRYKTVGGSGSQAYPLISNAVRIHPQISVQEDAGPPPARHLPVAQNDPALNAATFSFSGGTAEVELLVNNQVLQTFEFAFPAFTGKPVPAYDDHPDLNHRLRQIVIDANFNHRLSSRPSFKIPASSGGSAPKLDISLVRPGDVVVSLESAYGDPRLIAARRELTTDIAPLQAGQRASGDFVPHAAYFSASRQALSARISTDNLPTNSAAIGFGRLIDGIHLNYTNTDQSGPNAMADIPSRYADGVSVFKADGSPGDFVPDFDTGIGNMQDGGYVNRADEGTVGVRPYSAGALTSEMTDTFYSPSKQMPSAAMFGSLPAGVKRRLPWTTLLFRPDPGGGHPGAETPPDYLLLDLFWMPVVQPYAISEPFSTAGKVNMNFQIMPFAYIDRSTALHGLLVGERIRAVKDSDAGVYKFFDHSSTVSGIDLSYPMDIPQTLRGFRERFASGRLFITEAEICSLPLIPKGQTWSADFAGASAWWNERRITGDNMRERPYVNLLPRLTTKSNTYTVYVKAQALQKRPGDPAGQWDESRGTISAEYRGSTTVERFINPNNDEIPDYLTMINESGARNLDDFYRWRVVATRQFAP